MIDDIEDHEKHRIKGEIWSVNDEILKGLDDYEGTSKGYYERIAINVKINFDQLDSNDDTREAFVYVLNASVSSLGQVSDPIAEYTYEMHRECYKPIRHIQRKQSHYFVEPSTWGKVDAIGEGVYEKPNS
jgi:gamma-glutamylcyclotransferase (GGCT)/AIG2-like uncharacterized protein YtfP